MARPRKYTAEQLQKKIDNYFNWVKENPFHKYDVVKTGKEVGKELKIKIDRMPSIQGLCFKLDIDEQLWYTWVNEAETYQFNPESQGGKESGDLSNFFDIVTRANNQIKQEQISGGGSGLYQPMIVARLNKLKDSQDITTTTIDTENKTADEIRAAIRAIQEARNNK